MNFASLLDRLLQFSSAFVLSLLVLIFGLLFRRGMPKRRNGSFGIRIPATMRSDETWRFAHDLAGKIMTPAGIVLCLLTAALSCFSSGKVRQAANMAIPLSCVLVIIATTIYVARRIDREFDHYGRRR